MKPSSRVGPAIVLCGAVAAGGAQPEPAPPEAVVAEWMEGAGRALAEGEAELAESRLREALLEAWLVRASLHSSAGRIDAARNAYRHALGASAESRRPTLGLAMVEFEAGELDASAEWLRLVLAQRPDDVVAKQWMAHVLAAQGRSREAVQELRELLARPAATSASAEGRWSAEQRELAYTLATGLLQLGEVEEAESLLRRIVEEDGRPETLVLVGRTLDDLGYPGEGLPFLRRAVEIDPVVPRGHLYLGAALLEQEGVAGLEEAIAAFRRELELDPDDPRAALHLGLALAEARRYEEAIDPLRLAAEAEQPTPDAFHFLATSLLRTGRPGEAVTTFRRGLELADRQEATIPQRVSLHHQLGMALRAVGEEDAAREELRRAEELSSDNVRSARDQMDRYLAHPAAETEAEDRPPILGTLRAPRYPLADPERLRVVGDWLDGRIVEAYYNLGVLLLQQQRPAAAAALLGVAAEVDPDSALVGHALGLAHFQAGRHESAAPWLESAASARPDDLALRRTLALSLLHSDRPAEAARLLEDDPLVQQDPALRYALTLAWIRAGEEDEAAEELDRLLAEHEDWPPLYVLLGQAEARDGDYETARRHLRRAIELDEQVLDARSALAMLDLRQGRLAEAEEQVRAELELQPDVIDLQYLLANVLEREGEGEEAATVLRRMLRREPRHGDGRYLLGKILLAAGRPEEAEAQLLLARELQPDDFNVHYQLGLCFQRQGRRDEARLAFEDYRRLKASSSAAGSPGGEP